MKRTPEIKKGDAVAITKGRNGYQIKKLGRQVVALAVKTATASIKTPISVAFVPAKGRSASGYVLVDNAGETIFGQKFGYWYEEQLKALAYLVNRGATT